MDYQHPRFRLADGPDANHIARILVQSIAANDSTMIEGAVMENDILDALRAQSRGEETWVLEVSSSVLGWGQIRRYSAREGYRFTAETSLFIDREHVGRGLGQQLQRLMIERARTLGYHHLVAKIFADNRASIGLHEKLGYELVGVQREIGFKAGRWRDVAIMGLILDTSRDDI